MGEAKDMGGGKIDPACFKVAIAAFAHTDAMARPGLGQAFVKAGLPQTGVKGEIVGLPIAHCASPVSSEASSAIPSPSHRRSNAACSFSLSVGKGLAG